MKTFATLILMVQFGLAGFAQADSAQAPAVDSVAKKSTLTVGLIYANDASYYGQKALEANPYAAIAATYRARSGLYLSGLAYRLLHDTSRLVSAGNLGLGYAFKVSKRVSADISYTHTFYPAFSTFLQAGNPDNTAASVTYENWLSTSVSGDFSFGKTRDFFLTAGTGKQITLGHISTKDVVILTPYIDVTAGTQHFYQTYIAEKKLRDSLAGILLTPILGSPAPGSPKQTSTTSFNILSYNVKLPLAYSRSSYLVQIEYQLSVLSDKAASASGKPNSFVTASFYYQF